MEDSDSDFMFVVQCFNRKNHEAITNSFCGLTVLHLNCPHRNADFTDMKYRV